MRSALRKFARDAYVDPTIVILFGIAVIFTAVFFYGFRYSATIAQVLPAAALAMCIFLFVVPQRNISSVILTAVALSVPFAHFAVVVVAGEGIQWAPLFGIILIIHLIVRLILGNPFPMAPAGPWAIALIGASFLSAVAIINQPGEHVEEFWKSEIQLIFLVLMFFAISNVNARSRHLVVILRAVIILSVLVAIFGIYQLPARFFGWPGGVVHLSNPSLSGIVQLTSIIQHLTRASSIFSEPSFFGHYLLNMMALALTAALHRPKLLGKPVWIFLVVVLLAAALVICRSMAAFYILAQVVLVMLLIERGAEKRKIVFVSGIMLAVGTVVLLIVESLSDFALTQMLLDRFYGIYMYLRGDESYMVEGESLFMRIDTAGIALKVWLDNILIGVGLGSYTLISHVYGEWNPFGFSANALVNTLAEMGIVGFLALLGFALATLVGLFRIFRKKSTLPEDSEYKEDEDNLKFLARMVFYLVLVEFLYFHVMNSLFWPSAWIYFGLAGLVTLLAGKHVRKVRISTKSR